MRRLLLSATVELQVLRRRLSLPGPGDTDQDREHEDTEFRTVPGNPPHNLEPGAFITARVDTLWPMSKRLPWWRRLFVR